MMVEIWTQHERRDSSTERDISVVSTAQDGYDVAEEEEDFFTHLEEVQEATARSNSVP